MSLFNAMRALKSLGNMNMHKEVIIKTPLTTTIEGPANTTTDIPQPHGIPISMKLYPSTEKRRKAKVEGVVIDNTDPVEVNVVGGREGAGSPTSSDGRRKSLYDTVMGIPPGSMKALLGVADVVNLNDDAKPSKAFIDSDLNHAWMSTEVNLNDHTGSSDTVNALKRAYEKPCSLFDHEICSVNLRKAILFQSKSLVKIIVRAHMISIVPNPKGIPIVRDKSSIVNMMDMFRVTPLMVAAKVGNIKIVTVLLRYGADPTAITDAGETALSIGAKHHDENMIEILVDYGADIGTALCMIGLSRPTVKKDEDMEYRSNSINEKCMGFSHYGFSFEPILILSQPKFLLKTRNPVLEAFKVGGIIATIGEKKDEYLGDCEELEAQTDDFAYYYLDQCRSMWEALVLLHDQHSEKEDILQFALKRKKMKFISHHHCQQYIMDMWYGGVQRGRIKNTLKKLVELAVIHIFIIFLLIHSLYKLAVTFNLMEYSGIKNTRPMTVWQNLHVPVLSFTVDFFNFIVLIVVLIWTCVSTAENVWESPELVLWMCLAARFMVEMDKLRMQGLHFFKHAGNVVDLSISCCIIITILLRIMSFTNLFEDAKFGLYTSYIYATAFLGLMLRMLEMLDITYTLGPLEGAIGKMMMDVVKVCVLLMICMLGFSVSMWTVTYQSYVYVSNLTANSSDYYPGAVTLPSSFDSFNATVINLLWSTFGMVEPDSVAISYNDAASNFLKVLWGAYILTAMILFLNMLIAMLTETYVSVINNAETEWKYARSVVVTKYQGTHPFIFPMNLILYPLFLLYHLFEKSLAGAAERSREEAATEADTEAFRQAAHLHNLIKHRFKDKFGDVLNIPYYYRINIFNYYKTFPFRTRSKRDLMKRKGLKRKSKRAPSEQSSSSEEESSEDDQSNKSE